MLAPHRQTARRDLRHDSGLGARPGRTNRLGDRGCAAQSGRRPAATAAGEGPGILDGLAREAVVSAGDLLLAGDHPVHARPRVLRPLPAGRPIQHTALAVTTRDEWQLVDASTCRVVVANCDIADRYWSRFVGWQFRRAPAMGCGLLLVPCGSIHTCFLRFPLDL